MSTHNNKHSGESSGDPKKKKTSTPDSKAPGYYRHDPKYKYTRSLARKKYQKPMYSKELRKIDYNSQKFEKKKLDQIPNNTNRDIKGLK